MPEQISLTLLLSPRLVLSSPTNPGLTSGPQDPYPLPRPGHVRWAWVVLGVVLWEELMMGCHRLGPSQILSLECDIPWGGVMGQCLSQLLPGAVSHSLDTAR